MIRRLFAILGLVLAILYAGASPVFALSGTIAGNDPSLGQSGGTWGTFGIYPEPCFLQSDGQTNGFVADGPWSAVVYGQGAYDVVVDGVDRGHADGGGLSGYATDFAAGTVSMQALDFSSGHSGGQGGGSACLASVVVGSGASPTPEPSASPTPEPSASPTPEPSASPTPEPSDLLAAIEAGTAATEAVGGQVTLLSGVVTVGFSLSVFCLAALMIAAGMRR